MLTVLLPEHAKKNRQAKNKVIFCIQRLINFDNLKMQKIHFQMDLNFGKVSIKLIIFVS